MGELLKRVERMPIPVVATTVALCTLGNVYAGLGFALVRHISMIIGTIVFLAYLYKIVAYSSAVKKDYENTIFSSLYGVVSMLLMLLSSYYIKWIPAFKYVLIFAVLLHATHILVFIYLHVIKKFDVTFFMPSWFVTFNGIMVSTVVGAAVLPPVMAKAVLYWGTFIYTLVIPFIVYRLIKFEIKPPTVHTQAILLAPCSLIVVSHLNVMETPNTLLVIVYYVAVLLSLLFIIVKIPKFFSVPFAPGFAGLTFPMAIGIVATQKMSAYMTNIGNEQVGGLLTQLAGVQIYLTTAIVAFVAFNFYKMLVNKPTA